ncbi:hypothetical protein [Mycobacterium saskatchewanense]|nr:hypothetical protein [Mycobacterium saskatchewanense]
MANHELEQRAESAMAPSTLSYVVFAELDLIVAVDGYPTLDDLNRKSRTSSLS